MRPMARRLGEARRGHERPCEAGRGRDRSGCWDANRFISRELTRACSLSEFNRFFSGKWVREVNCPFKFIKGRCTCSEGSSGASGIGQVWLN